MPNPEIVGLWYATLDIDRNLAEDVDWEIAPGFPEEGRYRGREAVRAMFGRLMENFGDFAVVLDEMFAGEGGRVVALGEYRGTAKKTGRSFVVPFAHVWTVDGDYIRRVRHYPVNAILDRAMA